MARIGEVDQVIMGARSHRGGPASPHRKQFDEWTAGRPDMSLDKLAKSRIHIVTINPAPTHPEPAVTVEPLAA